MEPFWSIYTLSLLAFLQAFSFFRGEAATFTIVNTCEQTIWPGVLANAGSELLANGGFELGSGEEVTLTVPEGWSGRFWARTGCSFDNKGEGQCATGDCSNGLNCRGTGASPPATLAEFTMGSPANQLDFYDVSLVDGFNLPVTISPSGISDNSSANNSTRCGMAGCKVDLNRNCPSQLQSINPENGQTVMGCKSACLAFGSAQYCCSGAFSNPSTCQPSSYSRMFKVACPLVYTYAYDDPTSTFTCPPASGYILTFCPHLLPSQEEAHSGVLGAQAYKYNMQQLSGGGLLSRWRTLYTNPLVTLVSLLLHYH